MKIVIIIPSLNTGGAERTAVSLANWLSQNTSDDIYLINLGKKDNIYEVDNKVNFYNKKNSNNFFGRIVGFLKTIKYINKIKPDIIFEMLYSPIKYALINKLFNHKVAIIGSERGNPKRFPIKSKIVPSVCSGYIFQTEEVKEMFSNKIKKKSIVIPNAISNPSVYNIVPVINKEKKIVSFGRLEYIKGYDILIKAFSNIYKKYPEYKLIIYGEGNYRSNLEKMTNEYNLGNSVELPGNCNNVLNEVNKCEIFVLSSKSEGMPNALLEAMAIGLPVVSTKSFLGINEIIKNNYNGILVDVDNVEDLTKEIVLLIENKYLRQRISENAKQIIKNHSIDEIYKRYYEYFILISKK